MKRTKTGYEPTEPNEIILSAPEAEGAYILTVVLRTREQQFATLDAIAAVLDALPESGVLA